MRFVFFGQVTALWCTSSLLPKSVLIIDWMVRWLNSNVLACHLGLTFCQAHRMQSRFTCELTHDCVERSNSFLRLWYGNPFSNHHCAHLTDENFPLLFHQCRFGTALSVHNWMSYWESDVADTTAAINHRISSCRSCHRLAKWSLSTFNPSGALSLPARSTIAMRYLTPICCMPWSCVQAVNVTV